MQLASWALVAGIWGLLAVGLVVGWYALQLPSVDNLEDSSRRPGITIVGADGTTLATSGDLYGTPWRVADLPPWLPQAVVSVEDRRFYSHFGIDPIGLVRAVYVNQRSGRMVQGGSTITQQVAKNVFLTPERSLKRKIQEALLALWLEHKFTKDQILGIYLNRVYLGAGTYGVDAASRRYFGKPATDVTLGEAAVLAGLLKAPVRLSPARDPQAASDRARVVLGTMVDTGAITKEQAAQAQPQVAILARAASPRAGRYFSDWVLDQLPGFIGADRDLVVETTLDPRLQRAAEAATTAMLEAEGPRKQASEAAVVVMDTEGAVRAMVGGRDYQNSQFNRATQALRQPGSAFKPFVYLTALEDGMTPASMVLDAPITIGDWSPGNFERTFMGEITLTDALAHSVNTATVRLMREAGPKRVTATARRLGITSKLPNDLTMALGTGEVSLLELTAAYAAIGDGGMGVLPYGIAAVRDKEGKVLWRRDGAGLGRVIDADIAAEMDLMLGEVVRRGTGRSAQPQSPPPSAAPRAAGKTGTTQDSKDAWFVGYLGGGESGPAQLAAGVWFGNDDGKPMKGVTGGDMPARLWRRVMEQALSPNAPIATVAR